MEQRITLNYNFKNVFSFVSKYKLSPIKYWKKNKENPSLKNPPV